MLDITEPDEDEFALGKTRYPGVKNHPKPLESGRSNPRGKLPALRGNVVVARAEDIHTRSLRELALEHPLRAVVFLHPGREIKLGSPNNVHVDHKARVEPLGIETLSTTPFRKGCLRRKGENRVADDKDMLNPIMEPLPRRESASIRMVSEALSLIRSKKRIINA